MKYLLIFLMILIVPLKVDDVQSLVYECSKEAYHSSLYQKENEMFLNRNLFESRFHKLIKNNLDNQFYYKEIVAYFNYYLNGVKSVSYCNEVHLKVIVISYFYERNIKYRLYYEEM